MIQYNIKRGLVATCIRGVPNTGIQFAVYEGLKTVIMLHYIFLLYYIIL